MAKKTQTLKPFASGGKMWLNYTLCQNCIRRWLSWQNYMKTCTAKTGLRITGRKSITTYSFFFFFHKHSRFTAQQGKGEAISLIPLYHFHLLHRHLDSRAITAESSPLHTANSRTRTGNLWFPSEWFVC